MHTYFHHLVAARPHEHPRLKWSSGSTFIHFLLSQTVVGCLAQHLARPVPLHLGHARERRRVNTLAVEARLLGEEHFK
mgnify:CR=1 FL=1